MPNPWRNALISVVLLLAAGWALGAYAGYPVYGLLVVMSGLFVINLRRLIRLERTLSRKRKVNVPDGDGVWARVLAAIRYQQLRVRKHKDRHRRLMKEVRQSTNAMPDALIVLSQDFDIVRFNAAAERLAGLQKRRDRGQRIDNLLRHPDFVAYLRHGDFSSPIVIPGPVVDDTWLAVQVVSYNDNNQLLTLRDVTERTRLSRMRSDFVANASHELRTPLTVIGGYLEAMQSDSLLEEEWGKPLSEMSIQAQRMRTMLDELLALSQLEASAEAGHDSTVDMLHLVHEAVSTLNDGGRDISVMVDPTIQLSGEGADITSIVTNLVSNALRYSDDDRPIRVIWERTETGARLVVEDEGEGIAEADIPRLTERFFRVNRGRGRDTGGVGLGLAIVKHALARHDGVLSVESELGKGSRFICEFPEERIVTAAVPVVNAVRG